MNNLDTRTKIEDQLAYQLMQLIVRDPMDTKAFDMGLIDNQGKIIREPETDEEEAELTLLDKTTFYIRRLLAGKVNRMKNFATIHMTGDIEVTDTFMLRGSTMKDAGRIDRMDRAFLKRNP